MTPREALERKLAESAGQAKLLEGVAELFQLAATPNRSRSTTTAHHGHQRLWRDDRVGAGRFQQGGVSEILISGAITPGDNFAMMREVLPSRFGRAIEGRGGGPPAPDSPACADRRRSGPVFGGARRAGRSSNDTTER